MIDRLPGKLSEYSALWDRIRVMDAPDAHEFMRWLGRNDLYFLLRYLMKKPFYEHPFLLDRCREVQKAPDGRLDLWARGHCKSTTITVGLTVMDILNDPEITIAILSYNRPTAKAFLNQIKSELEFNETLKGLYPDVLYADPQRESPKWSSDEGLRVKRKDNPKEQTIEAWGLIDAMPTGRHFKRIIYDDVVTLDACVTPEAMKKVTTAWEMSTNLECGALTRKRYIGTRYHFHDTYHEMISRGSAIPRIWRAVENGKPVFMTEAELEKKRRDMGPYVFAAQMMQNPVPEGQQAFRQEWLRFYREKPEQAAEGANIYMIVDPATSKGKGADYTAMWVVACRPDQNYYVVDGVRKRGLKLKDRTEWVFRLHRKWSPRVTGYEQTGISADREHIEETATASSYRFRTEPLIPPSKLSKEDRIRKLAPLFENERIWLPDTSMGNFSPEFTEAVKGMLEEEYLAFPFSRHDDGMDCLAWIVDNQMKVSFPNRMAGSGYREYAESFSVEYNPFR